jgi:hypothetical protein
MCFFLTFFQIPVEKNMVGVFESNLRAVPMIAAEPADDQK